MAHSVVRGITLLFLDRGIWRVWVVTSKPRPHFTPGKDSVPILREAGWVPGPVWKGGKSRPHRDLIPGRSQSLYRLSHFPTPTIIFGQMTGQAMMTPGQSRRRWEPESLLAWLDACSTCAPTTNPIGPTRQWHSHTLTHTWCLSQSLVNVLCGGHLLLTLTV